MSLLNAETVVKYLFTDTGDKDYSTVSEDSMTAVEPALSYSTSASTGATSVSFEVRDSLSGVPDASVALAVRSKSGICFAAVLGRDGSKTEFQDRADENGCDAAGIPNK